MARAKRRKLRLALSRLAPTHIGRGRMAVLTAGLAATALIAYCAGALAFTNITRSHSAPLASRFGDTTAQLFLIQQEAQANPTRLLAQDVEPLARRALLTSPLNPVPLRVLALRASIAGKEPESAKFAVLSERLTRRDLPTQLLLIEQAVVANDYRLALRHYDIALRARSDSRGVLFPVLSAALADDEIRAAVVPYVRGRANWLSEFVEFAVRDGADGPRRIGMLLVESGAGGQADLMQASGGTLIGLLTDQRQFALAERLYMQMADASSSLLGDTRFNAATTDPKLGTFAWATFSEAATGAGFEATGNGRERQLRVFAGSGERGVVVRRVMRLKPGAYKLSEARSLIVGDASATAHWNVKCLQGTAPILLWTGPTGRIDYNASGAPGPTIPGNCSSQLIELVVAGGTGQQGMELVINRFMLTR